MSRRFDDIAIGDFAEVHHVITEQDIERFVSLTGDDNRLHVDAEFARTTSFKGRVVHGMLGAAFISTVIGTKLPGDGALWYSQNLEFLHPVRIGDELRVRVEVVKKIDRTRSIELRTEIFNQRGEKVTAGTAGVRILEETSQPAPAVNHGELPKVAIVLGATGGIGAATALKLAENGFDVVLNYFKNRDRATELQKQITALGRRAVCVQADVAAASGVDETVNVAMERFGAVGAAVNCAAPRIGTAEIMKVDWSHVEEQLDVHVRANLALLKAVVGPMKAQGCGRIVFLTTQAVETPPAGWLPYVTAKAALQGMARAAAVELAPKGILVNLVSPGMIDTDLIVDIPEKVRLLTAARTPARRLGHPQDVAAAIAFLVSADASFLAGETLRVNGGQVML
jgi:3-oxoacyl-[acyl-carrier protein] reductase